MFFQSLGTLEPSDMIIIALEFESQKKDSSIIFIYFKILSHVKFTNTFAKYACQYERIMYL